MERSARERTAAVDGWQRAHDGPLRRLDAAEFARRLELDQGLRKQFAVWLGAGCSVSSGIPAAAELVQRHWLPRLHRLRSPAAEHEYSPPQAHELCKWAAEQLPAYDPQQPAASYAALLELLLPEPEQRAAERARLCAGAVPSRAYGVLAELVLRGAGCFDLLLTSNFDDLVAQALRVYTACSPLVVDASAAGCTRAQPARPLLVQVAGDTPLTAAPARSTEPLAARLRGHGLIVLGHGGLDGAIHALLAALPAASLPHGCYWVHPDEPDGPLRRSLERQGGACWVQASFEDALEALRDTLELPEPRPRPPAQILLDGLAGAAALALQPSTAPALRHSLLLELLAHAHRADPQSALGVRLAALLPQPGAAGASCAPEREARGEPLPGRAPVTAHAAIPARRPVPEQSAPSRAA